MHVYALISKCHNESEGMVGLGLYHVSFIQDYQARIAIFGVKKKHALNIATLR